MRTFYKEFLQGSPTLCVAQFLMASVIGSACFAGDLIANDGNRIYGCVTDAGGQAVLRAKVAAYVGGNSRGTKKKADVSPSSGCYELKNLQQATYTIYLEDKHFGNSIGPPQGTARFISSGRSIEINLSTSFPKSSDLTSGLFEVIGNASSGFIALRDRPITEILELYGLTGDYVATRVLGFNDCIIRNSRISVGGTRSDPDKAYSVALHECQLQLMLESDFADAVHKQFRDAISDTVLIRFAEFGLPSKGNCNVSILYPQTTCFDHTKWSAADLKGDFVTVELAMYRHSKREYFLQLQVTAIKSPRTSESVPLPSITGSPEKPPAIDARRELSELNELEEKIARLTDLEQRVTTQISENQQSARQQQEAGRASKGLTASVAVAAIVAAQIAEQTNRSTLRDIQDQLSTLKTRANHLRSLLRSQ